MADLIPEDVSLIQDFLLTGDVWWFTLDGVTLGLANCLREVGFLVKPKRTPIERHFYLGKFLDLVVGGCPQQGLELVNLFESLQWALHPKGGMGPLLAGPLARMLWGPQGCEPCLRGLGAFAQVFGHTLASGLWAVYRALVEVWGSIGFGSLHVVLAACGLCKGHPTLICGCTQTPTKQGAGVLGKGFLP